MPEKSYCFISSFDEWLCDIMELNDNKYLEQELNKTYHIVIFYSPGPHRIFIQMQLTKSADQTQKTLEDF